MKVADSIESIIFYLLAGIVGLILYSYFRKHKHSPMILVGIHAVLFVVAHGILTSSIAQKARISSTFEDPAYIIESIAFVTFSIASFIGAFMLFRGKVLSLSVPSWAKISYTIFGTLGFVILITATVLGFNNLSV